MKKAVKKLICILLTSAFVAGWWIFVPTERTLSKAGSPDSEYIQNHDELVFYEWTALSEADNQLGIEYSMMDYFQNNSDLREVVANLERQQRSRTKERLENLYQGGRPGLTSPIPEPILPPTPEPIPQPGTELWEHDVFASNALSEHLARHMLVGEEIIELSAYPEAKDSDYLLDIFYEAVYQNPLVLNVVSASLTADNTYMKVEYGQSQEELKSKQAEIIAEVARVTAMIITDDMSDLDKEIAINDYLCATGEYDVEAFEDALQNDMIPDKKYDDSFTPYGILIKKVGVCSSYASSFQLLAEAAGLECIIVTGVLDGTQAHAWNRVNIEGQWLTVDVTNNDHPIVPNSTFNLPDYAARKILEENDKYVVNDILHRYTGGDREDLEYYRVFGLYYDKEEIVPVIVDDLLEFGSVLLRTNYDLTTEELGLIMSQIWDDERMVGDDVKAQFMEHSMYYALGVIAIQE